jgi:FSR family fosmidomycin resistance protein-like MFS transporter
MATGSTSTKGDASFRNVLGISFAHFVHDVYSAFLTPLLPLIREKMNLGYALAGGLATLAQLPSLLNPVIGYIADRASLRYFVVFAPAVTATLMCCLGLPNDYMTLAILMLAAGVSIAAFHAPAPAMIGAIAGRRVGMGMSLFMGAGELARTLGPVIAVGAVGWLGLEGLWRLAGVGWLASGILFWRLGHLKPAARPPGPGAWKRFAPGFKRVFPILTWLVSGRVLLQAAVTVYLPIFLMDERGVSLEVGAGALALVEGAGFLGALTSGTASDRWGRRRVLAILISLAPVFLLLLLYGPTWLTVPLIVGLGLTALSMQPVMLAIVQDEFPENRALANGTYMGLVFVARAIAIWGLGLLADLMGLVPAFTIAAVVGALALPAAFLLPHRTVAR